MIPKEAISDSTGKKSLMDTHRQDMLLDLISLQMDSSYAQEMLKAEHISGIGRVEKIIKLSKLTMESASISAGIPSRLPKLQLVAGMVSLNTGIDYITHLYLL